MDFDTLINGTYKIVIEPIAYLYYSGQQFAMTATELRSMTRWSAVTCAIGWDR